MFTAMPAEDAALAASSRMSNTDFKSLLRALMRAPEAPPTCPATPLRAGAIGPAKAKCDHRRNGFLATVIHASATMLPGLAIDSAMSASTLVAGDASGE